MSFVTVKLYAQMGNMMFMISACATTAWKNGVDFKIPRGGYSPELPIMPFPHLPSWEPSDGLGAPYVEEEFGIYHEIPYSPKMRIDGYFQNEKYFKDYRQQIIDLFNIPYHPIDATSIHVRRTDYLKFQTKHPPIDVEYITRGINYLWRKDFTHTRNFMVFSDDIPWCKENLHDTELIKFQFSEGKSALEDLSLLSSCRNHIISNSTFSWWGAWLCQNPDKIVVCPKVWFGPGNNHLKYHEICPESWIRM
jgi:hypothetical protein